MSRVTLTATVKCPCQPFYQKKAFGSLTFSRNREAQLVVQFARPIGPAMPGETYVARTFGTDRIPEDQERHVAMAILSRSFEVVTECAIRRIQFMALSFDPGRLP